MLGGYLLKTIAVIYKSIYGTTKQYATWIAEELHSPLFEASTIKPEQLLNYDIVIYGGGLYASGILGVKLVTKYPCKSLIIFTVGLATPKTTDYSEILAKNFTSEFLTKTKVFHFHGGMDYGKLKMVHKAMMTIKKKEAEKMPVTTRTSDDQTLLETYGKKIDFTNKEAIKPLIDYIHTL